MYRKRLLSGALAAGLMVSVGLFGCQTSLNSPAETTTAPQTEFPSTTEAPTETEEPTTEEETEAPITISLVSIGDMLMHYGVNYKALWSGNWDYSYLYGSTHEAIAAADLAIVNNECPMGGNELGNISYPCFNVRTELGDTEVATGFDVILCASNHTMDQGINGLLNTANFWDTNYPDIAMLGIHATEEDAKEITVVNVQGIDIALLNYTYGLNGYSLPEDMPFACDLMTDWTKEKIQSDITRARDMADFVIVFPHWGTEYTTEETDEQRQWAQFFADQGVDLIIGTHPHVCEPVKWISAEDGRQVLCYYSLGNFTSLQPWPVTMLGGMANVSITKDHTGTYISDYGMKYLVTQYEYFSAETPWVVTNTYYLDEYTDELAAKHSWTVGSGYEWLNTPFSVAGLKELAKSITPDLVDY